MSQFLKGLLLLIVSFILVVGFTMLSFGVSVVYYLFAPYKGLKVLGNWLYLMALSLDQFGNVSCAVTLQYAMSKKGGYPFGDEDLTVSYVLGKNKQINKLTWFGRMICNILHLIDKNHVEKAVYANENA